MQTLIGGSIMAEFSRAPYISWSIILPALKMDSESNQGIIEGVSNPIEVAPPRGYITNHKHEIVCGDVNGNKYKITIQDIT